MSNIPQQRLILYLMIAGLMPILFAAAYIYTEINELNSLKNEIETVQFAALSREKKQSLNMTVREHFKNADHFYIDKHLETLDFKEPEIEELQKLVNNKNFAGDEAVKKRLDFLIGPSNTLLFSEGNIQTYPFFKETIDTMVHPIEVNISDLKEILALIEGQEIGPYKPGPDRPQLIIIDFKFDKKEVTEQNDALILNMKLLMREYL